LCRTNPKNVFFVRLRASLNYKQSSLADARAGLVTTYHSDVRVGFVTSHHRAFRFRCIDVGARPCDYLCEYYDNRAYVIIVIRPNTVFTRIPVRAYVGHGPPTDSNAFGNVSNRLFRFVRTDVQLRKNKTPPKRPWPRCTVTILRYAT